MNTTAFEEAEEEIADSISAYISYFGDPKQRNLWGLEFVAGAAVTLATIFLHSFLAEANVQTKRFAKAAAKRLGDEAVKAVAKKPAAQEEAKRTRRSAKKLAGELAPAAFTARVTKAEVELAADLEDQGMPPETARGVARKIAASLVNALTSDLTKR